MKRYLVLLSTLLFVGTIAFAQEEKNEKGEKGEKEEKNEHKHIAAPAAAKAAFQKAFPGATNARWGKEDADYEVSFKQQGKSMSAVYDGKGMLKETETDIAPSELPAGVMDYVKQHYKTTSLKEAAKITKPNGDVNYEAAVGKTALIFDANGKFIKSEKD